MIVSTAFGTGSLVPEDCKPLLQVGHVPRYWIPLLSSMLYVMVKALPFMAVVVLPK